jgi:hypothetical protein
MTTRGEEKGAKGYWTKRSKRGSCGLGRRIGLRSGGRKRPREARVGFYYMEKREEGLLKPYERER